MPVVPISQRTQQAQGYQPAAIKPVALDLSPIADGAKQAAQVWQKTIDDADNAAAYQAATSAQSTLNSMLWDKDTGLFNTRRGEKAIGVADEGLKQFDAWAQQERGRLKNPRQVELFDKLLAAPREGFQRQLLQHQSREFEAWQGETYKNAIQTAHEGAGLNYGDDNALDAGLIGLHGAIATRLQSQGADNLIGDEIKRATGDYYASAVIGAMANKDYARARLLLTRHDGYLSQEQKSKLNGVLGPIETEQAGIAAAQSVIKQTGAGWSIRQVDDALVSILGNDQRALEYARKEVRYQRDIDEASKREAESGLMRPVDALLGDARLGGQAISRDQASSVLSPLRLRSPEAYAKASALIDAHNDEIRRERQAADDRARAAHERALRDGAKGDEASTSAWYTLKTNPSALRAADLLTLRTKGILSERHFNDLVGDKKSLIEKRASDESILSDKAAVDMVLDGAKIKTGKDGDQARLALFYERFNQRVREAGKPLDQAGKVAIARELLAEVVKERSYWFDTTRKSSSLCAAPESQSLKPISSTSTRPDRKSDRLPQAGIRSSCCRSAAIRSACPVFRCRHQS